MRALCSLNLPDDDLRQVALFHIGKRGVVITLKRHAAAQPRQKTPGAIWRDRCENVGEVVEPICVV